MTSEKACIEAIQKAAAELDTSPSKAEYEQLDILPSSATIIRTIGGWNKAKKKANLQISTSTGSRTEQKPNTVHIPAHLSWDELTVDQRWHYLNAEVNAKNSATRRSKLRAWLHSYKELSGGCNRCSEDDPACLDFHHLGEKEMAIGKMVSYGYGKTKILAEIEKCEILCANCHRKEHYTSPKRKGNDNV